MKVIRVSIAGVLLLLSQLWLSASLYAAPIVTSAQKTNYLFIENNIDNEYFVTPTKLDPRFTGANVWTKYPSKQVSLGYMGVVLWAHVNRWVDMWIDNSSIHQPFLGLRCTTHKDCPATGYKPADLIDENGFYHVRGGIGIGGAGYGFAALSDSAYEHFRQVSAGTIDTFSLNYCSSLTDYQPSLGQRCSQVKGSLWRITNFSVTKTAHLKLIDTNALAEISVASDGTPILGPSSMSCVLGVVGKKSGVICRMLDYDYQVAGTIPTKMKLGIELSGLLSSIAVSTDEIMLGTSFNSKEWFKKKGAFSDLIVPNGDGVYVFLANTFLKKLVESGVLLSNARDMFTFAFDNSGTVPESGFYGFTPSNAMVIKPLKYGISIISDDLLPSPKKQGTIGKQKEINFGYTVKTTGPRQADTIFAQVSGKNYTQNGLNYCLFTAPDNSQLQVLFPAYLEYLNNQGTRVKRRNSCADNAILLNDAWWTPTPWQVGSEKGFFYETHLTLNIPLNDPVSLFSLQGDDWLGSVEAQGEVTVIATWNNTQFD